VATERESKLERRDGGKGIVENQILGITVLAACISKKKRRRRG